MNSDEFYITIVSNIVPENTCNIQVGETEEEKAESLSQLIQFLETIVEMNLSHINGRAIIWDRDETSVKDLLELILELIIILKQEQGEESNQINENIILQEPIDSAKLTNISENNRNNIEESVDFQIADSKSCPDADLEEESNSQINYKENYSQNDLTRYEKVMAYLANNEELLEAQNEQIDQDNMNAEPNIDESRPTVNISRISEVSRSKENSEPHSNPKLNKQQNNSKNMRNDSEILTVKHTQSNKLIPQDSYLPSKVSSVDSKLLNEQYNQDIDNLEEEEYILDENTESVELEMKIEKNRPNISNSNYINKVQTRALEESNRSKNASKRLKESNRSTNKSEKEKSGNSIRGNKNVRAANFSNISNKSNTNLNESIKKGSTISNNLDKYESSNFQEENNDPKLLKKIKSQKQLINKSKDKSVSNKSKSEISMSSVHQSQSKRASGVRDDDTENLIDELPINEDNLKFEIMKEYRRLYGNKLDRILLNNNIKESSSTLEVVLRNIRLAKQKMSRLGIHQTDSDDLITKEFMLKYSKELEYIISYYQNEERKRNFFKKKTLNSMTKNVKLIQKIQEIENKNIEEEIERRRKSRELRSRHNHIKICNEIYSKALELEKQKYLEERANQAEIRKNENNEKRMIMTQIENYYKDKITILKEILKREKYEKEIEHRSKIQFLSKFEREKKFAFKKQIDKIFERLDEEDRKNEFLNSNSDQLENVLNAYYRK